MKTEVNQLIEVFSEIFKSIHQRSYHKLAASKLYPGQPQILILIKDNEGITQKELSEKNCVKPATITGMLNKLEANHLVYRLPDDTDKRIMRVYLTPAGRHISEHAQMFMSGLTDKLFRGFSDEELHSLLTLIEKIRANLNDKPKDE